MFRAIHPNVMDKKAELWTGLTFGFPIEDNSDPFNASVAYH